METELICEICGKRGWHEPCSRLNEVAERQGQQLDEAMVVKLARYGSFGLVSQASRNDYLHAKQLLESYLGREIRERSERAIEGTGWWFIPEGWIGMLGFIVEIESQTIYPLGSGLHALNGRSGNRAPWGAIEAYLKGEVDGIRVP